MDYYLAVKNKVNLYIDLEGHSCSFNWMGGGEAGEILYRMILKAVVLYRYMFTHLVKIMETTHQAAQSGNLCREALRGKEGNSHNFA